MANEIATQTKKLIAHSAEKFKQVAQAGINFDRESAFAAQVLLRNDYAAKIASSNPGSLYAAMVNVASTGLTLNPAHSFAYLVPRDGAIFLDVSYKGLIKIATDTGAVRWARADLVYANDKFDYNGPADKPTHTANPFGDRGEIVGAYCVAKTSDGDVLCEVMSEAELQEVRNCSTAWTKKQSGPWKTFPGEMRKKAVIKRASKTWPYTERGDRLVQAIELANEAEGGYEFENDRQRALNEAVKQHAESIRVICEGLDIYENAPDEQARMEGFSAASEAWFELTNEERESLWVAPTKFDNAPFTTGQRDIIKSREFRLANMQEAA